MRFWTAEEDALLIELWSQGIMVKRIAANFGRTSRSVESRLKLLRRVGSGALPSRHKPAMAVVKVEFHPDVALSLKRRASAHGASLSGYIRHLVEAAA